MPKNDESGPTSKPTGAPSSPSGPPDSAPPRNFSDLSDTDRTWVVESLRPRFQQALANHQARKAAEAEQLARAA